MFQIVKDLFEKSQETQSKDKSGQEDNQPEESKDQESNQHQPSSPSHKD